MIKSDIPTMQEIEKIYSRAENGDAEAYQELSDLNYTLATRANSRMDYLRSKDVNTQALSRADYWLSEERGSVHFSKSKKLDLDDLYEQLNAETQFLRSKTSTMKGEKERIDKAFDKMEEQGYIDIPEDPDEADYLKKEMGKFFGSNAGQEILHQMGAGGTNSVVSKVSEIVQAGGKIDDLISMYNESLSRSDVDLFDVWDGWQQGNTEL